MGDDDQTIYQWRGSQVSNILTFTKRYSGVRQIVLDENFRSSKGVVELARSVAERIPSHERLPKAMIAAGYQTWERGVSSGRKSVSIDSQFENDGKNVLTLMHHRGHKRHAEKTPKSLTTRRKFFDFAKSIFPRRSPTLGGSTVLPIPN